MIFVSLLCFAVALVLFKGNKLYRSLMYIHGFPKFQTAKFRNSPEIKEAISLSVDSGKLPSWLNGVMYRIGPGKYILGEGTSQQYTIQHAFDGMPFMHRFQLLGEKQKIRYNSCHLSKSVEKSLLEKADQGRIFFGHLPRVSTLQRMKNILKRLRGLGSHEGDASSEMVGVTATPNFPLPEGWIEKDNETLVAKTDANVLQYLDSESLEPKKIFGYHKYNEKLNGQLAAAHHQYDPITKEVFNFTLKLHPVEFTVFSIDKDGKSIVLANVTHRLDEAKTPVRPAYIHSFWLTRDYIVLPEHPLYYVNSGVDLLINGSVISSMAYDASESTYLHIISRKPGEGHIATAKVDASFMFHVCNGWNDGNELFLDGAVFPNGDILQEVHSFGSPFGPGEQSRYDDSPTSKHRGFHFPPKHQAGLAGLWRYKVSLKGKAQPDASYKILSNNIEFPRLSQDYTLKKYNYLYGTAFVQATEKNGERFGIVKLNLRDTNNVQTIKYDQPGHFCSEPIFAPRPGSTDEDDGVLLTFVNMFNHNEEKSDCCFLIVLNAKDLTEVARCKIGDFTATTFHGSYVDHEFKNVSVN